MTWRHGLAPPLVKVDCMLASLIAASCLASTRVFLQAASITATLPKEVWGTIISNLSFAALYEASFISKDLRKLACYVFKTIYCFEYKGLLYLNYTRLIYEHDKLVQNAAKGYDVADANLILKSSIDYSYIQSLLETQFGYCIRFGQNCLPKFELHELSLSILNDRRKISVLPYVLDQKIDDSGWTYFIDGLAELERWDLLEQMRFPKIGHGSFSKLMATAVPESVIASAAKSLWLNNSGSLLSRSFSLAGFGAQRTPLPEQCSVHLCVFQFLHAKGIQIPEGWILIDGLEKSSIRFWMYLLEQKDAEAKRLRELVLKHGDTKTVHLASAFKRQMMTDGISFSEREVYNAMLIRFRFSSLCNQHIIHNYSLMLAEGLQASYCSLCAFLDHGQSKRASERLSMVLGWAASEAVIERAYRVAGRSMAALYTKYGEVFSGAPKLLKRLLKRNVNDPRARLVWSSIQSASRTRRVDDYGCLAPLATLKRLLYEKDISAADVTRMVSTLDGFRCNGMQISQELHVLYTVIFWEVSENVIAHFLDQVPEACKLECDFIWGLLLMKKYSKEFCGKLLWHIKGAGSYWGKMVREYRPDLAETLDLITSSCQSTAT